MSQSNVLANCGPVGLFTTMAVQPLYSSKTRCSNTTSPSVKLLMADTAFISSTNSTLSVPSSFDHAKVRCMLVVQGQVKMAEKLAWGIITTSNWEKSPDAKLLTNSSLFGSESSVSSIHNHLVCMGN